MQFDLNTLITLLLISGAINWGLIAYNGTDVVTKTAMMSGYPIADRYVKVMIGLAGVYALYQYIQHM